MFLTKLGPQENDGVKRNASEPLNEGDLIELECVAHNSKPAANITWLNGQDVIGASDELDSAASNHVGLGKRLQTAVAGTRRSSVRTRRFLQRQQVQLNADSQTYNTHAFLSVKLSRHEHRAQLSCQAQNAPMRQPLIKSIELQVQCKFLSYFKL